MTKDEALDLALDALDNLLYWDNGKSDYDQAREAITAIKQARSAPVQEPVGTAGQLFSNTALERLDLRPSTNIYITPPAAQRQWVSLPDDDVDNLSREMVKGKKSVNWLSYSIEAKLKELNT